MLWSHGEDSLKQFLDNLNNFHETIKFIANWSHVEICFLDTRVCLDNGHVHTDLYKNNNRYTPVSVEL